MDTMDTTTIVVVDTRRAALSRQGGTDGWTMAIEWSSLRGGGGSGPPIARNATTNYLFCLLEYEVQIN
eukprot:scaffold86708_cov48-Attheya_sp.AAC.1